MWVNSIEAGRNDNPVAITSWHLRKLPKDSGTQSLKEARNVSSSEKKAQSTPSRRFFGSAKARSIPKSRSIEVRNRVAKGGLMPNGFHVRVVPRGKKQPLGQGEKFEARKLTLMSSSVGS